MERLLTWLWNVVMTAGEIVRQAVVSFRYNWGVGLLSLVLALSLWVFVTDRENPDQTGRVPGTVPVQAVRVPPDQAIFPPLQESITVRVRAPESVFEELTAEDFQATIDLAGLTGEQATVDVDVEALESRVTIIDVTPSQVTVSLASVMSRTVPVRVKELGGLPRGFRLGDNELDITEAVVTGPEPLVRNVASVEADVNLTGADRDIEQRVPLQARDERGSNIEGVEVDPVNAVVRVQIIQVEFSGVFIVRPDIRGLPDEGYRITAIQVDPAIVVVTGAADVLQSIDAVAGIETETVSIDGATDNVVQRVTLRLPEDASIEPTFVTVRISIEIVQDQQGSRISESEEAVRPP